MCGWLELEMALASRFLSSIASATLVSLLRGRQDLASRSAQWSDMFQKLYLPASVIGGLLGLALVQTIGGFLVLCQNSALLK